MVLDALVAHLDARVAQSLLPKWIIHSLNAYQEYLYGSYQQVD